MAAQKFISNQNDLYTVLIISQDADMVSVWETLFEQRNCTVISEVTPYDGIQTSNLLAPALVIVDIDLPEPERLALCRELRNTTNGTLLLINSNYNTIDPLEYHRAGVDETVINSISPLALLIKSLAWLARSDWIVPRRQPAQLWS